jgi:DNA polymerase III alpha subunit
MTFASLHTHSEHSELDATAKISELFQRAAELGQTALAITDHGTLSGLWKSQQAADANGVKLIPGIEAYLAIGSRFDRNTVEVIQDGRPPHPPRHDRGGMGQPGRYLECLPTLEVGQARPH